MRHLSSLPSVRSLTSTSPVRTEAPAGPHRFTPGWMRRAVRAQSLCAVGVLAGVLYPAMTLDAFAQAGINHDTTVVSARASAEAYNAKLFEPDYQPPAGLTLIHKVRGEDGFQAASFRDTKTNKLYVAIAGTQVSDTRDVTFDAQLAAEKKLGRPVTASPFEPGKGRNLPDSWVDQTNKFYKESVVTLARTAPDAPSGVVCTGHSAGGVPCQVVAAKERIEAHTFNSPGVPDSLLQRHGVDPSGTVDITNHVRVTDKVGQFGSHLGTTKVYDDPPSTPVGTDGFSRVAAEELGKHEIERFAHDLEHRRDFNGVEIRGKRGAGGWADNLDEVKKSYRRSMDEAGRAKEASLDESAKNSFRQSMGDVAGKVDADRRRQEEERRLEIARREQLRLETARKEEEERARKEREQKEAAKAQKHDADRDGEIAVQILQGLLGIGGAVLQGRTMPTPKASAPSVSPNVPPARSAPSFKGGGSWEGPKACGTGPGRSGRPCQ